MWKIVKLCFGLILLGIAIHGQKNEALKKKLFQMADAKESIDGKFMPLKNGLLGEGVFGVVFKGKMIRDKQATVAMKFIRIDVLQAATREYEIYSYLKAVDNPKIERFGIPNVYYYNEWNGHMIMVFSYFGDGDLIDGFGKGHFFEDRYINSLILFREFVRQSKYLHSRGVRHDDIKPDNIMLRKHRSFLIDFNSSAKMNEDVRGGTLDYVPRSYRNILGTRSAKDDWESFLYSMCRLHSVQLEWFDNERIKRLEPYESKVQCSCRMKDKTKNTIEQINHRIKSPSLKRVFLEFANQTFQTNSKFPDYDGMYDIINAEINKCASPWFTWLTPNQIAEAKQELIENPLPNIRNDIADPKQFNFVYEAVDFRRFHK